MDYHMELGTGAMLGINFTRRGLGEVGLQFTIYNPSSRRTYFMGKTHMVDGLEDTLVNSQEFLKVSLSHSIKSLVEGRIEDFVNAEFDWIIHGLLVCECKEIRDTYGDDAQVVSEMY